MLLAPRIPELARRDRFIRRAVAQRVVFSISDNGELAPLASRRGDPHGVVLMWAGRKEAERWADVVAQRPRVVEIGLGALLHDVLPRLDDAGMLLGTDWTSDTIEPEIAARDLDSRLRVELLDLFVHRFQQSGRVWILEGLKGPASLPSHAEGTVALACWSGREIAEEAAQGPWSGMRVLEIPLAGFSDMTVPWLEQRGWMVAADPASPAPWADIAPALLLKRLAQTPRMQAH